MFSLLPFPSAYHSILIISSRMYIYWNGTQELHKFFTQFLASITAVCLIVVLTTNFALMCFAVRVLCYFWCLQVLGMLIAIMVSTKGILAPLVIVVCIVFYYIQKVFHFHFSVPFLLL